MSLQEIENVLEGVKNMDVKKVSEIIQSYVKYNIYDRKNVLRLELKANICYFEDDEGEDYDDISIGNAMYLINEDKLIYTSVCEGKYDFENGEIFYITKDTKCIVEPDEKYIFIQVDKNKVKRYSIEDITQNTFYKQIVAETLRLKIVKENDFGTVLFLNSIYYLDKQLHLGQNKIDNTMQTWYFFNHLIDKVKLM